MNIAVIGTGYVGLVSGVCFAELGNTVICVDHSEDKIELLQKGEVPIYEPGLKELIESNVKENRLYFTSSTKEAVINSEIVIIAVGTPSLPNGEADLSYIQQAAKDIGIAMNSKKIIVTKSTVPVGTNELVYSIIQSATSFPITIASVPEFLREGSAISDSLNPDRIIIGINNQEDAARLIELHSPLTSNIYVTDIRSAEMIKYASNAFLATKISFINEISNICEKVGADVTEVAKGMGYDKRIGNSFLQAGIGYGGSCFPKDTEALIQIAGNVDYEFKLLKSVVEVNKDQRFSIINKLIHALGDLNGKTIGILGLAFKPNTDDVRDSPAIEIIEELIKLNVSVKVYDPVAMPNFRNLMKTNIENIIWCNDVSEVALDCDALCLLTEWTEFRDLDLQQLSNIMTNPILIDGRNLFDPKKALAANLMYYSMGRQNVFNENLLQNIQS
ncbi:UDP-glucose/GDP-mannose dehydrogenase family protein [Neobacillus mesonae]|nr:UDP-glucose/GDP-mannose dehydrogenase family protein [Neobacillus mesonae]